MDDVTLTKLICSILGTIPGWEWRPDGPAYTEAETAIVYGALPSSPDLGIGVRLYGFDDQPVEVVHQRRAQLRYRGGIGRPHGADELAAIAATVLGGVSRFRGISSIERISGAPLGADDNGREQRTDNFLILLDNLEAIS